LNTGKVFCVMHTSDRVSIPLRDVLSSHQ
jgi:hypothetical protein